MSSDERSDEPAGGEAAPDADDDAASPEEAEDDLDIRPVEEKIGEGGTNLRDREAALGRRRGRNGDRRSP